MNNFIHQNKLDSVSAFCLKKMDLEILRNAIQERMQQSSFHILKNTSLNG